MHSHISKRRDRVLDCRAWFFNSSLVSRGRELVRVSIRTLATFLVAGLIAALSVSAVAQSVIHLDNPSLSILMPDYDGCGNDDDYYCNALARSIVVSDAPAGAVVTSVRFELRGFHEDRGQVTVLYGVTNRSVAEVYWGEYANGAGDIIEDRIEYSEFDGQPVNQTWYLYFKDQWGPDDLTGSLDWWRLTIYYTVLNSPPHVTLFDPDNNERTTDRRPTFSYEAGDSDLSDDLTVKIYISDDYSNPFDSHMWNYPQVVSEQHGSGSWTPDADLPVGSLTWGMEVYDGTETVESEIRALEIYETASVVHFPDPSLEAAIRNAIGKQSGDIFDTDLAGLTRLNAYRVADLEGIQHCVNLQRLELAYCEFTSISQLGSLTNLTWLRIMGMPVADIGPLSSLTNLRTLYLSSNHIVDINPLSDLTSLGNLDLRGNEIEDIGPLSGLTGLTRLLLGHNSITSISALSNCIQLRTLAIYHNRIVEIKALSDLTQLESLEAGYNMIVDVGALANLTNLTWLNMDMNDIVNISPLAGLNMLEYIFLRGNEIVDIRPLSGMSNLRSLFLHYNQVVDISPLSGLSNLFWLGLDSNHIVDIPPLSGLPNIRILDLDDNRIVDISHLSGLTQLTHVGLERNRITNISALSDLVGLVGLRLGRNQIISIESLANLDQLRWLDLDMNQGISDISPLGGLINLLALDIHGCSIADIAPLVNNIGIGSNDEVNIQSNNLCLSPASPDQLDINALVARGVDITYDYQACNEEPELELTVTHIEPVQVLFGDSNGDGILDVDHDGDGRMDMIEGKPWAVLVFLEVENEADFDKVTQDVQIDFTAKLNGKDYVQTYVFTPETLVETFDDRFYGQDGRFYLPIDCGDAPEGLDGDQLSVEINAVGANIVIPGGGNSLDYEWPLESINTDGFDIRYFKIESPDGSQPTSEVMTVTVEAGTALVEGCYPVDPDEVTFNLEEGEEDYISASRKEGNKGCLEDIVKVEQKAAELGADYGCGIVDETYFAQHGKEVAGQVTAGWIIWFITGRYVRAGLLVQEGQPATISHELGHTFTLYTNRGHEDYDIFDNWPDGEEPGNGYWVEQETLEKNNADWPWHDEPSLKGKDYGWFDIFTTQISFMGAGGELGSTWAENSDDSFWDEEDYNDIVRKLLSETAIQSNALTVSQTGSRSVFVSGELSPTGEMTLLSWRLTDYSLAQSLSDGEVIAHIYSRSGELLDSEFIALRPVLPHEEGNAPIYLFNQALALGEDAAYVVLVRADGSEIPLLADEWQSPESLLQGRIYIVPKLLADAVFNLPDASFVGDPISAIAELFGAIQAIDRALALGGGTAATNAFEAFQQLFESLTIDGFPAGDAYAYGAAGFADFSAEMRNALARGWSQEAPPSSGGGSPGGLPPIPQAGPDQTVSVGENVQLTGDGSYDPDCLVDLGDCLDFEWTFAASHCAQGVPVLQIPADSAAPAMQQADEATALFIPDVPGQYNIKLTVTDGNGTSTSDTVLITAIEPTVEHLWLDEGWNLLSLPLHPLNTSANDVFSSLGEAARLRSYEGNRYVFSELLTALSGFWAYSDIPTAVAVTGRAIDSPISLPLETRGWHLIGVPYESQWKSVQIHHEGQTLTFCNAVERGLVGSECITYDTDRAEYFDVDELLPDAGYWVLALTDDVTLEFTPGASYRCNQLLDSLVLPPPPPYIVVDTNANLLVHPSPCYGDHMTIEVLDPLLRSDAYRYQVRALDGSLIDEGEDMLPRMVWNIGALRTRPTGPLIVVVEERRLGTWRIVGRTLAFVMHP